MTASMILWTLEFLEWVRQELSESWPTAKLRGSAPDINPEPYRIRFRAEGAQYWLVLSPDAVQNVRMEAVASLLESTDWISTLKATGGISVDTLGCGDPTPVLIPWSQLGPERNSQSAHPA